MKSQIRPLNFVDHGSVKLKPSRHFPHAKNHQVVPVIVHEFTKAATEMPVVFVKNTDSGEFQPVAVLGFESKENLFYSESGWKGRYVPAILTHHPIALMPVDEKQEQLQVVITESEALFAEKEGEALFNEKGEESDYLIKRKNAVGQYVENTHVTSAFVKFLVDKELLVEQTLKIDLKGNSRQLTGLYLVDEKRLNALSDDDFLFMRKRGYLVPIYAHMLSVHQLNSLAALKTNQA